MPEGPEVRRSTDALAEKLVGQRLANAFVGKHGRYTMTPPDGFKAFLGEMAGLGAPLITEVNCKGKFMWWKLDFGFKQLELMPKHEPWYLWITYGMSGQWNDQESPYTAFGVYYGDTLTSEGNFIQPPGLYFNDIRHFGTLKFVNSTKTHTKKLASLGPDMLSKPPEWTEFMDRLQKKNRTLAEALMDQSVVSGVGNYVKAEALYLAELSPHRTTHDLQIIDMMRLRNQIINVMRASYANNGATFNTYRNPDGTKGGAQRRFVVYGNKTDPIGNPVVKEETKDGRTTHWVPAIQK